ncbi:hypothetical protein RSOLAG22IIIB_12105 [Rhizoctonia solani]|nr:hypothetical protein RSOLAG22IIIB_12105 [Rhizoctonia solani]
MFDMNPNLPDGSFSNLTKLSILGLEAWGVGTILEIQDLIRRLTAMKLEFYFDEPDRSSDENYSEVQRIFEGLRGAPYLRELRIFFPFDSEEGERPANVYHVMGDMGPHSLLEDVRLDGIRIDKEDRRICHSIGDLSSIWPNVHTLSMPSQHASIRDLEDFATLPSLRHLTIKLNLKDPYLPAKPDFKAAPLKTLTSSGPVRLSTIYEDLYLSARALLILWPSLERVIWSDEDPTRMKLADFFNSEVLRFSRESVFGIPQEGAQMSANESMREMKALFKSIPKDSCELGSDSDSDSDSDWNPKSNAGVAEDLESE